MKSHFIDEWQNNMKTDIVSQTTWIPSEHAFELQVLWVNFWAVRGAWNWQRFAKWRRDWEEWGDDGGCSWKEEAWIGIMVMKFLPRHVWLLVLHQMQYEGTALGYCQGPSVSLRDEHGGRDSANGDQTLAACQGWCLESQSTDDAR